MNYFKDVGFWGFGEASGGEIEVPGPLGTAHFEPQQAKINQQGTISLIETVDGKVETMMLNMHGISL